jgi:nucleotide-binding universal stress UspA family protein
MAKQSLSNAIEDFRRARSQAAIKDILARFTGQSVNLLSFEDVRKKLKAHGSSERGLQDIPLSAIIGSVNRYEDFTRDFLPRGSIVPDRWARIEIATQDMLGLDAIEVYQIGDAYFVKDGNHRVSVARQMGASHIQAYVTEIHSRVPLSPDVKPEDLILMAEYADFLEKTGIDQIIPGAELTLSAPGQYPLLEEHIQVHKYYMGIEWNRDISWQEAVTHWYEHVYEPIRQIIWSKGILKDFPGRTEADLYLWISEHQSILTEIYGREIKSEYAASDLAAQFSSRPERIARRWTGKIRETILSDRLETGPAPGAWRLEKEASTSGDALFSDLLVSISGHKDSWCSLDAAIEVARREGGRLYGLHVRKSEEETEPGDQIQDEFYRRINDAGLSGRFLFSEGDVTSAINEYSRWSDLVVVHLAFPPSPKPLAGLSSGWRKLIQRNPRPILATPSYTPFERALLAYDGSPKSNEALYVATYLSGKWGIPLWVLAVFEAKMEPETLLKASLYLEEHGLEATYIKETGSAPEKIVQTAEDINADLLLMGGYGSNPVVEVVLGNTVDQVLRQWRKPILICR